MGHCSSNKIGIILTWSANADAILNLYIGSARIYIEGFILTVTGTGEQTEAALVAKGHPDTLKSHLRGSIVIIQGPYKDSDIDALLALHEATKLALTRARSLSESRKGGLGFADFAQLTVSS